MNVQISPEQERVLANLAIARAGCDQKKLAAMDELMEMARRGRRMVRRHGRKTFPRPRRRRK